MLNMRFAMPSVLVDLALVEELQRIERVDGVLAIGAGVRHRAAERSALVQETCPLVVQSLRHVGHVQIRNRGTVGGSLAHADPSAELPAVAVALDAELVARGPGGERTIPAREFFLGPYTTALAEDEILTQARFPVLPGWRTAFAEVARRNGDFALAAVAAAVRLEGGAVAEARLACVAGGVAPVRLDAAAVVGAAPEPAALAAAGAAARAQLAADDAGHDPEQDYRRALVETLTVRALEEVTG